MTLYRFYHYGTRITVDATSPANARKRLASIKSDHGPRLRAISKRHMPNSRRNDRTATQLRPGERNIGSRRNTELDTLNAYDHGHVLGAQRVLGTAWRDKLLTVKPRAEKQAMVEGHRAGLLT